MINFYKHRWDIEKVFYQFKTKFNERKSWATSKEAKQAHAIFECLSHNLLLLMEGEIQETEQVQDKQSEILSQGRHRKPLLGFINHIVTRATHRSLKFIRWLRNHLLVRASWEQALKRLTHIWCLN